LMYDNAGTTQTLSSNPSSEIQSEFDQNAVAQCTKLVDDLGKGLVSKGEAPLEIQTILQRAISESDALTQANFKPEFTHFLELLDHASDESPLIGTSIPQERILMNLPENRMNRRSGKRKGCDASYDDKYCQKRQRAIGQTKTMSMSCGKQDVDSPRIERDSTPGLTHVNIDSFPLNEQKNSHSTAMRSGPKTLNIIGDKLPPPRDVLASHCPSIPLSQWTLLLEFVVLRWIVRCI
ncbi:hypothetical protein P692DRAFT_20753925, partial [Suillus brevipes Sb2]